RDLSIPLPGQHILQVERRLRLLLSGERDLGQGGEAIAQLALRRLPDRPRRIHGALCDDNPRVQAGQGEEGTLDAEDDLLVRTVEAEVRGQQALLRRVPRMPSTPEVEEQPAQAQYGNDLLQIGAEESTRGDILGGRERSALIAPEGGEGEHRVVLALDEADTDGGSPGGFPGHPGVRVQALG